MKSAFVLTLALLWSINGYSQAPVAPEAADLPTIHEYLKAAPAHLYGRISFEQAHRLFHDEIKGFNYLEGSLQPNQPLDVWISKTVLQIKTKGGMRVSLAGVPIQVTSLTYNNQTNVVDVKSSVLGIDAGDHFVERRMAQEIKNKFHPKLKKAFSRLIRIRKQNTISEAANMLNEVINVFKSEPKPGKKPGPPLPTFSGSVSLVTEVPEDQSLQVGPVVADLVAGNSLSSTVLLRVPSKSKVQIRGFMFSALHSITIRPKGASPNSIKTAQLLSFYATEEAGFGINATNGADDLLSGGKLLIGLIRMADRGQAEEIGPSTLVQDLINAKAQNELSQFVVKRRPDLLRAGATPELLNALEKTN